MSVANTLVRPATPPIAIARGQQPSPLLAQSAWYVAETLPRAETQAERNLQQQGFSALCPRFIKTRRHARRSEQVLAPLFPGYLFVQFDRARDPWRAVNGTFGIRGLVSANRENPQPVPHEVMEALAARCENGVLGCALPELHPGKQVRIISGPFVDQLATITKLSAADRVAVLLETLGRPTQVVLPKSFVGAV